MTRSPVISEVKLRKVHGTERQAYARVPTSWLGVQSGGVVEIVFLAGEILVRRHSQAAEKAPDGSEVSQP